MSTRQILIIDDHPLLATGLVNELRKAGAEVDHLDPTFGPEELIRSTTDRNPDCVVVDLGLPFPGGGPSLIGPLVDEGVRVVVLTGETERRLLARSSALGAEAVLSKAEPLPEIVETILQVAEGHQVRSSQRAELAIELQRIVAEQEQREAPFTELSPREREVLAGLMDGRAPAVLAKENYVSVATVRSQIKSVLGKLGVSSQLEAVAKAHRQQWNPGQEQS